MHNDHLTLLDVSKKLSLTVFAGRDGLSKEVSRAIASDLMSDVLAFSVPDALLVTALANVQSVVTANISDALAILYTRGKKPEEAAMAMAENLEIPLLGTGRDTFSVCAMLCALGIGGPGVCDGD